MKRAKELFKKKDYQPLGDSDAESTTDQQSSKKAGGFWRTAVRDAEKRKEKAQNGSTGYAKRC